MHVEKHAVSFIYQATSWEKRRRFCVENVLSRVLTSLLQISFGISGISTRKKWWVKHQSFVPVQQQTEHQTFFFISKKEMSVTLMAEKNITETLNLKVTITQQQASEAVMNDLLKKPTFKGDVLKKKTLAKSSNVLLTDCNPWGDDRNFSSGNSSSHLQNRNPTHPSSKSLQQNP